MSERTVGQHPIKVLSYTTRYFWLLIIPIVRSLYSVLMNEDSLRVWLKGTWLDLAVVGAILIFAWRRWAHIALSFDNERLVLHKGKIYSKDDVIYYRNISTLSVKQNLPMKLVGACTVSVGTNAGALDRANITVTLKRSDADRLYLRVKKYNAESPECSVSPSKGRMALFTLLFSSSLSGTIVLLAFLYQTSRVFDRTVEAQLILNTLSDFANRLSAFVSPVAAAVGIIIFSGRAVSLITNVIYFWDFFITKCAGGIYIKSGLFGKNLHIISSSKVNYIDLKQNFFAMLLKISSLHCHCVGYGSTGRSELSVVMPIATSKELTGTLFEIFPEYPEPRTQLGTDKRNCWIFYYSPITMAIFPLIAFLTAYTLFPEWRSVAMTAVLIAEIPALWLAAVKTISVFVTGLGMNRGYLTMKYSRAYTFHTVVAPMEKVTKVMIRQSYLQSITGSCTAVIYTASTGTAKHRITGLNAEKAKEFFARNGVEII